LISHITMSGAGKKQDAKSLARLKERLSETKNKMRRQGMVRILKTEQRRLKMERKTAARKEGVPKQQPKTLETMRLPDVTVVGTADEEILGDEGLLNKSDDTSDMAAPTTKILLTVAGFPSRRTRMFCRQLAASIPNCEFKWRNRISLKCTTKKLCELQYTSFIVVTENREEPASMVVSGLPSGPTATFRLRSVMLAGELSGLSRGQAAKCAPPKRRKAESAPLPIVLANNFTTRLGIRIQSLMNSLFQANPINDVSEGEVGGRVITFHNQRDYIFFRQHMFTTKSDEQLKNRKCRSPLILKEVGLRFTLQLRSLQPTTFDSKQGEYEWVLKRHEMETSRRKFFL